MKTYLLPHCVYVTYHATGKFYVGKGMTRDVLSGKYQGSGKVLKHAFQKYPRTEWVTDIVSTHTTGPEAFAQEAFWVDEELLMDPYCLNLHTGGRGGGNEALWKKTWRNPEHQSRMSKMAWAKPEVQKFQADLTSSRWKEGPLREQQAKGTQEFWADRENWKHLSARKSELCANRFLGRKWMHKDGTRKLAKAEDMQEQMNAGWLMGRG